MRPGPGGAAGRYPGGYGQQGAQGQAGYDPYEFMRNRNQGFGQNQWAWRAQQQKERMEQNQSDYDREQFYRQQ